MAGMRCVFMALGILPSCCLAEDVSGIRAQAASAALVFQPAVVYPYHYGLYDLPGGARLYVSPGTATWCRWKSAAAR
jgi:hypothetical protein